MLFQIAVVCLVILDALFVLCELLMDLSILKADKDNIAPQVSCVGHSYILYILIFKYVILS